ncbi:ABC transporter substrate-binding protein [Paramaledivibacter caminithermalis]|jgi:multiple sugar transport system substrate-binding protein|uniref:Multiple sugar transport system substrate-binding protein n=1 Tax=Paramaledivibacter caminithermalis (strain DSM 15212 / CIP 107654 / DViRD3) TaxID=1121301 RepID=A0A1M6PJ42_PARC5|nr:sugar ABC transporter substrate-binding protein [Paramaledivibacter caminithermalis]SHK07914.1 multiple sugar transport system substrate-binding protein [Paramaledivibacter caminithermalis DSM 15212]
MKKILSIILCVALMTTMLVGCGDKATSGQSDQGQKQGNEPVTLTFALWDKNQEPVMQEIVKKFEETHPNIKVDVQLTPYKQYFTKLETAAQGGEVPDVFWMNGPRFMKYAANGILMPITEKVKSENIDLSKYPQGLIDLYSYKDNLYGIPKDWDVTALWYNKRLFDEAGVDYPTNEWTWEDMKEAAKKLTNTDKGVYGIAARADTQEGAYNTIPACGGYIISDDRTKSGYDTAGNAEGIKVWIDLIKEGVSPTVPEMDDTSPISMFQSEKVAMIYAASWNVPEFMKNEMIKDNVDLVVMPKIKGNRGAVIHGLSNVIYSGTKHPEEAWELVKYLASKEANEIWAKSGVVIPAHTEALDIWKNSYPNINLQAFIDTLDYATMYPSTVNTKWFEVEWDTYIEMWNEQISVEEGCKIIYDEMTKALKQDK